MSNNSPTLELAKQLISRASVTPEDAGCQQLMTDRLAAIGFEIKHLRFDDVDNFLLSNHMTKDALDKKAKNLLFDFGFSTNRIDSLIKSKNINKTISGGEAQRIAILRLFFSSNVKLCLFDEPTASLDKKNIFLVSNLINKLSQEKICLVITHDDYLSELIAESNKKYLELK